MACPSPSWLARLLRRADEWLSDYSIPTPDHRAPATPWTAGLPDFRLRPKRWFAAPQRYVWNRV
jgi:hypothetical protein